MIGTSVMKELIVRSEDFERTFVARINKNRLKCLIATVVFDFKNQFKRQVERVDKKLIILSATNFSARS